MTDIADLAFSKVSDSEKRQFEGNMKEGTYQGYKLRQYWVRSLRRTVLYLTHHRRTGSTSMEVFVIRSKITIVSIVGRHARYHGFMELVNKQVHNKEHPEALRPLMPEIEAFAKHNHFNVLHPVLRYVSYSILSMSIKINT